MHAPALSLHSLLQPKATDAFETTAALRKNAARLQSRQNNPQLSGDTSPDAKSVCGKEPYVLKPLSDQARTRKSTHFCVPTARHRHAQPNDKQSNNKDYSGMQLATARDRSRKHSQHQTHRNMYRRRRAPRLRASDSLTTVRHCAPAIADNRRRPQRANALEPTATARARKPLRHHA